MLLSRNLKIETCSCLLPLRLQIAGFAAGQAIVLAVVAKADIFPALTKNAEALALAAALFLVALRAEVRHMLRVVRLLPGLK